jgi:hypothetical protein
MPTVSRLEGGHRERNSALASIKAALDRLATTPPTPCPNKPLPVASPRPMKITIYGWSTR